MNEKKNDSNILKSIHVTIVRVWQKVLNDLSVHGLAGAYVAFVVILILMMQI
jgi:hypothetical protein